MIKTFILFLLFTLPAFGQYGYKTAYGLPSLNPPSGLAPPPVAGYTMWLTVRDATTMFTNYAGTVQAIPGDANGGQIAKWLDKSIVAGTNHVRNFNQGTARPFLTNAVAALNGQKSMQFRNAAGQYLFSTNIVLSAVSGSLSVFAVGVAHASTFYNTIWAWAPINAGVWLRENNTANQMQLTTPNTFPTTGNFNTNQGYVFSFRFDNTANTADIWTNLVVAATQAGMNDNLPGSSVCGIGWVDQPGGAQYNWNGFISEVIVYPSALSNADMTNVINYLKTLYIP